MNTTYTIKYTGKTYHVAGIAYVTEDRDLDYSLTACPSLSRNANRMANGESGFSSLADVISRARVLARVRNGKVCAHCEKAAERVFAAGLVQFKES
jgi:hypothetical protein